LDQKEKAAEELRLTPDNMIIWINRWHHPEPLGGAHWNYAEAGALLSQG